MRAATLALLFFFGCRSAPAPAPPAPAATATATATAEPAPAPVPAVTTDWCAAGLAALDETTCYVLPPLDPAAPRRLLVYLHGIVPPIAESEPKEKVMRVVERAAKRAGAAALVPRGIRGVGPSGAKDWWAWPTSPKAHAEHASSIAARIAEAKAKLEALAGAPFDRTYLAGSSNGAYFAVNLALRGEIEADALGAMSGGAPSPIARRTPLAVYVGYGAKDPASMRGAKALARVTEAAGFPTKLAEHPFGHGAREEYLDEAFAFWDEAVVP